MDDAITITVRSLVYFESQPRFMAMAQNIIVHFLGRQPGCENHAAGYPHAPCWTFEREPEFVEDADERARLMADVE